MRDRDAHLGGDQRCGDGGIYVTDDDQHIRPVLQEHRLEAFHDLGRLFGLQSAAGCNSSAAGMTLMTDG